MFYWKVLLNKVGERSVTPSRIGKDGRLHIKVSLWNWFFLFRNRTFSQFLLLLKFNHQHQWRVLELFVVLSVVVVARRDGKQREGYIDLSNVITTDKHAWQRSKCGMMMTMVRNWQQIRDRGIFDGCDDRSVFNLDRHSTKLHFFYF